MKKILLFILLLICENSFAQIRKEQATYANCNNLKTAMAAKGKLTQIDVNQAYYSGGSTETHLLVAEMQDNTYRTVVKNGTSINFDFVEKDDASLVRLFTKRELDVYIANIVGVSFADWTKPATNYIFVITYNGVNYSGSDSNLPNSMCKALINLLNTL